MYKIACISGSSYNCSKNKSWSDYFFTRLELVKFYIEKLSVLHPDCIFEIVESSNGV